MKGLAPQAMQKMMLYEWPGNVRELENTIEYSVAMTRQDMITEDFILQTKEVIDQEPLKPLREAEMRTRRAISCTFSKYAGQCE